MLSTPGALMEQSQAWGLVWGCAGWALGWNWMELAAATPGALLD